MSSAVSPAGMPGSGKKFGATGWRGGVGGSCATLFGAVATHRAHLWLTALGGLLAFLPLMSRTPWHVTYALHYASLPLSSTDPSMQLTYLDTCIMALMLLVPVAVDVVVDWSWYARRSQVASHDLKLAEREMLSLPEKVLLVAGLAVAPITGVLPVSLGDVALTQIYMCCIKCQFILVVGVIMTSLSRWDARYWNGLGTTACLLGHIVSQVIALYYANAAESGDANAASSIGIANTASGIGMASFVIQIFTVFGFFLMTCRWLLASRHAAATVSQRPPPVESFAGIKRAASESQPPERGDVPFTLEQFILDSQAGKIAVAYPLLYTLLSLGVFAGIMIFLLVYTFNYNWVAGDFVGINLAIVAIEFLLVVYTVRKSKSDVLQALNAVKEGKKVFVRYIAHEIRTPLNTAFLGLKIVIDDLKEKEEISAADKERLDTCEDVYKAVLHAVEILNGILTFDKIEGGLMGLNATHIPVRPLVTDCVSHFEREAQRLGIRLALVVPSEEMPLYEELEKLFGGPKGSVHRVSARQFSRSLRVNDADPLAEATVGGADGNGTGMAAVNHILGRVAAAAAQFKSLSRSDSQKLPGSRRVPPHVMDPNRSPYLQDGEVAVTEADLVHADALKLRRVIHNLLSNGIKFAPPNRGHVTVRVTFVPDPDVPEPVPEVVVPDGSAKHSTPSGGAVAGTVGKVVGSLINMLGVPGPLKDLRKSQSRSPHASFKNKRAVSADALAQAAAAVAGEAGGGPGSANTSGKSAARRVVEGLAFGGGDGGGSGKSGRGVGRSSRSGSLKAAPPRRYSNEQIGRPGSVTGMLAGVSKNVGNSIRIRLPVRRSGSLTKRGDDGTVRGKLRIVVTDDGVGLSEANQQRLFTEIVSFNPEVLQAGEGSGFGLYISKSIVDLHKGTIAVASKGEGHGCAFTVELPMSRVTRVPTSPHGASFSRQARSPHRTVLGATLGSAHTPDLDVSGRPLPEVMAGGGPAPAAAAVSASALVTALGRAASTGAGGGGGLTHEVKDARRQPRGVDGASPAHVAGMSSDAASGDVHDGEDHAVLHVGSMLSAIDEGVAVDNSENSSRKAKHVEAAAPAAVPVPAPAAAKTPPPPAAAAAKDGDAAVRAATATATATPAAAAPAAAKTPPPPAAPAAAAVRPAAPTAKNAAAKPAGKAEAGKGGGGDVYHVLVVDDSHLTRKMLTKTLKTRKHTCEEAEDGDVAVRMVKEKLASGASFYDAILMDYVMPGMSGPDATAAIRALGVTCPIIGVTGNTLDMDVKRFRDMGANEVFGKPFNIDMFATLMSECRAGTDNNKNKN